MHGLVHRQNFHENFGGRAKQDAEHITAVQMNMVLRDLALSALLLLLGCLAGCQSCGFSRLADISEITAICCESLDADDCSAAFPPICASTCADVIVPFWEECGSFVTGLTASTFAFSIEDFGTFAGNCKNTRALVHFSDGRCHRDDLQTRVTDIQQSCCVQDGINVCVDGTPWACNAECAVPFMTFFTECIEAGVMNVADLTSYRTLYKSCTALDSTEMGVLIGTLDSLVSDPACFVNTSVITSFGANDGGLPRSADGRCVDDDAGVAAAFGDPAFTCAEAVATSMCAVVVANAPGACSCACPTDGSGPVCHNDDEGLAAAFGDPSFTCTSAAVAGMCSVVDANAPGMCGCSCGAIAPGEGHRRSLQESMLAGWAPTERSQDQIDAAGIENADLRYYVVSAAITLDADLSDWGGVPILAQTPFRRGGTVGEDANGATGGGDWCEFDEYNGGIHNGIADQSMAFALAWQADALYMGVNAIDDTHQNPGDGWNGDTLQIAFTDAARTLPGAEMILYNYGIHDDDSTTLHHEAHPCSDNDDCTEAAMRRTEDLHQTIYEIRIPARGLGVDRLTTDFTFGFGMCLNDGDEVDTPKGWSGWGPYSIVYGKNSPATGLVTITGDPVWLPPDPGSPHDTAPGFLPFTQLFLNDACPLDSIDDQLYAVSEACCTAITPCPTGHVGVPGDGIPTECTFDCNRVYAPFMTNCYSTIAALVSVHSAGPNTTIALMDEYSRTCRHFSVASMATAVYEARCGYCGDGKVDDWLREECDEGGTATSECTTGCKLCTGSYIATESGSVCVPKGTGLLESIMHSWGDTNRARKKFTLFALPYQGTYPEPVSKKIVESANLEPSGELSLEPSVEPSGEPSVSPQLCSDSSYTNDDQCAAGDDGELTIFNNGGTCAEEVCQQSECCLATTWNTDNWQYASAQDYQRLCHAWGLRPVNSDHESYISQMTAGSCAPDQHNCMGAYGQNGRCSSSDCDDVIYSYNNAWGGSEHGFRPDNPTDASWQGQGFVMNAWDDPTNQLNAYPWDNGGWGGSKKLALCGLEYDDEQCGGGENMGCLSPGCVGPGCIDPASLVPEGTERWDSSSNGETWSTEHGRQFTLFKLPLTTSYPQSGDGDWRNNWWMEMECQKYGLRGIGCHDIIWNNALGMPTSWGCNIAAKMHSLTGWNTMVFYESSQGGGMCADFNECSPDQQEAHLICGYEY